VVHIFGDEAKYLKQEKLNKLFPALRGDYRLFGHSHYFMGQTFCSDMADPNNLEYDWMLQMEKNMDRRQILRILQTAIVLNEISYDFSWQNAPEPVTRRLRTSNVTRLSGWNAYARSAILDILSCRKHIGQY